MICRSFPRWCCQPYAHVTENLTMEMRPSAAQPMLILQHYTLLVLPHILLRMGVQHCTRSDDDSDKEVLRSREERSSIGRRHILQLGSSRARLLLPTSSWLGSPDADASETATALTTKPSFKLSHAPIPQLLTCFCIYVTFLSLYKARSPLERC